MNGPDPLEFAAALAEYRRAVEKAARAEREVEDAEREMRRMIYDLESRR